jgi:hypothetical protein
MDKSVEENIRKLAQPLWESAAQPYGMAMDFWLMAEQMVLEMMAATARMQDKATGAPPLPAIGALPSAVPVDRVRELAECMWESAGRQYGMAQDYWLAAERHVLTMMRAATALPAPGCSNPWAAELNSLSPAAYLERIRSIAYYYWEAAGRGYGRALDYWLQAERDLLNMAAAEAERNPRSEGGNEIASTPEAATRSEKAQARPASTGRPRRTTSTEESRPT